MQFNEFIELSAVLTGVSARELSADAKQQTPDGQSTTLGQIYLDRLQAFYPTELDALATAWREAKATAHPVEELGKRLTDPQAAELRKAVRQVVKIWYLTAIDDQQDATRKKQVAGDLGQYQHGIVWSLLKAQVQGYSNLQHGYWVSKPQSRESNN